MHSYIIGQSGTGKSTYLKNLILNDESGFCLLDPHGDLADDIADAIDCIYFDPSTIPIGLNVLENVPEDKRHLVAEEVLSAIRAVYKTSWGPNLEDVLRNALFLLLDNSLSLVQLPQLLSDNRYRTRLLRRSVNPEVTRFWSAEFPAKSDKQQAEELRSTQNKVRIFALNPILKSVFSHTTINLARVIQKQQHVVANLSKTKLGETPSHLIGALLLTALYQAAQHARTPFTIYADEFQNFATDSFVTVLSEARKFGLFLVLAHQFLGQLTEELRQAVLGNVGSISSFRLSPEDARVIAPAIGLQNPDILSDLSNYNARINFSHPPHPRVLTVSPPQLNNGRLHRNRTNTIARYT